MDHLNCEIHGTWFRDSDPRVAPIWPCSLNALIFFYTPIQNLLKLNTCMFVIVMKPYILIVEFVATGLGVQTLG